MDNVKLPRDLKAKIKVANTVNEIVEILKQIPSSELSKLKTDNDMIEVIGNLVLNSIEDKYDVDKNDVVLQVLQKVCHNITEEDKQTIINTLKHLKKTKIVRKIPFSRKLLNKSKKALGFLVKMM